MIFIPKRKDIIGQQFGELTVVEMLWNYENKHRTYCRCIGIDQNEYIIRQDALTSGVTHTIHGACSGGIRHDISGQKFGRLTALEPTAERASNGGVRWKCMCDCGNIIYPTMNNLTRGHTTSCGCAKDDYINSLKTDIIGKQYGKLTVIEEVFNKKYKRRMVKCLCECGNIHICSINDLTSGHVFSCGCYKKSKGEIMISEILDTLGIVYIEQQSFEDCKNIKRLRFDFYLPELKICIEYDGKQHYEPVEYFGGEDRFIIQKQNDEIKAQYCLDNNIKLLRIKYDTKKSEMIKIINDLVSPATITA